MKDATDAGGGGDAHDWLRGPNRPTEAQLDEMALEEDERRAMDALGAMAEAEYGKQRDEISERFGIPLAWLDREYKRRRRDFLKGAGTTKKFLTDPEPFPFPIEGPRLARVLIKMVRRHVIVSRHAAVAVILWIVFAHCFRAFNISPILAIESPEKRCGKTSLLLILQHLVRKPLMASNLSAAVVFRLVDEQQPTLLMDEVETYLTDERAELRGILNGSHSRDTAWTARCEGESNAVRMFSTFCPKCVALIGEAPDTVQDRSVGIPMRRKLPAERVHRRRADRTDDLHILCRRVARWAADNIEALRDLDPLLPPNLNDRAADNWRPLVSIADQLGGDWPILARKAAAALSGGAQEPADTRGVRLLRDVREVLTCEWLSTAALIERLVDLDEAPWRTWAHGKPISDVTVGRMLAPYGIRSRREQTGGKRERRYHREDFVDAWSRYLREPPVSSGHPGTSLKS
jgi:putative DNA primase/helicase